MLYARGQPWVLSLSADHPDFCDSVSHWPRTHQLSYAGQPESPRHPPVSGVLELQVSHHTVFVSGQGIELRSSCSHNKYFTNELFLQPQERLNILISIAGAALMTEWFIKHST